MNYKLENSYDRYAVKYYYSLGIRRVLGLFAVSSRLLLVYIVY